MAKYNNMNKDELKKLCSERGISFDSTVTKGTLIRLLELNDQPTFPSFPTMPKISRPLEGAEGDPPPPEVEQEEGAVTPEVTPEVTPADAPAQRPRETLGNQPPASPMSSVPPPTWALGPNSELLNDLQYHEHLKSYKTKSKDYDPNAILQDLCESHVVTVSGNWDLAELWGQIADMLNFTHAKAKAQADAQAEAEKAQRKAAEAQAQAEAEAKRKAEEAQAQRKAEAQRKAAEAQAQAEAEKAKRKAAEAEAQRKAAPTPEPVEPASKPKSAPTPELKPAPKPVSEPGSKPELKPQPAPQPASEREPKREPKLEREVVWGVSPRALIFIIALVLVFAGVVVGLVVWDRAQERAVAAQLTQGVIDALQSIGNQK